MLNLVTWGELPLSKILSPVTRWWLLSTKFTGRLFFSTVATFLLLIQQSNHTKSKQFKIFFWKKSSEKRDVLIIADFCLIHRCGCMIEFSPAQGKIKSANERQAGELGLASCPPSSQSNSISKIHNTFPLSFLWVTMTFVKCYKKW